MSSHQDATALIDMVNAARKILRYKQGLTKTEFCADDKTQSSILYQLLIMGEAVKRLSPELREQYSAIPWSLIAGMRDNLIHDYDDTNLKEVWNTANRDIPSLLAQLEALLANET